MGRSNVASIAGLQQSSTETDPSAADSGELTQHSDLGKYSRGCELEYSHMMLPILHTELRN